MSIVVKDFPNKTFSSKEELFKELKANKEKLIASKMATIKQCDSISYTLKSDLSTSKESTNQDDINTIRVKAVANSCGWFDSHHDVHLKGCWDKTSREKSSFYHLKQHQTDIDSILSYDAVKGVEQINVQGYTVDALIGESVLDKDDNPSMFKKYLKGKIRQHSVGMLYIKGKFYLCIDSNDEEYAEEKANFDKYYPQIINKEAVDELGYFWGVAEAKAIEFSAVGLGSNSQTPTLEVTEIKHEPSNDTQHKHEPTEVTHTELVKELKDYFKIK